MLLDTTILVDLLRGREAALEWLDEVEERATLSVISLTEVYAGARNRREERQIAEVEAFFAGYRSRSISPAAPVCSFGFTKRGTALTTLMRSSLRRLSITASNSRRSMLSTFQCFRG